MGTLGEAAQIRREYERRLGGFVKVKKVAKDIDTVLQGRKELQRAADALADAAAPYSGDPRVAAALEGLRKALGH
jgi:hypothetical protein